MAVYWMSMDEAYLICLPHIVNGCKEEGRGKVTAVVLKHEEWKEVKVRLLLNLKGGRGCWWSCCCAQA